MAGLYLEEFTLGLVIGLSIHDTTLGTTVANLGMTDTVFPKPVFIGDTIRVETEVIDIRPSKSRPGQGHRHAGACRYQSTRRGGLQDQARGADAEEAGLRRRFLVVTKAGEADD
jgi:acyl dehydratase